MKEMSSATILVGNVLERLQEVPDNSVQTCITSPPYWGLRDYGTASWTGGDESCEHVQDASKTKKFGNEAFNENRPSREETKTKGYYFDKKCGLCGAVRDDDQIGLESTPAEFVEKLCKVFDEVWRVLKDDGTLWLNLGDSYVGGKGASGQGSPDYQAKRADAGESLNQHYHQTGGASITRATDNMKVMREVGLKAKDLVGIPWRVAFALQARGWYLRQDIIWAKPNPMPESVTDRCTKSHEYLFLLSKSPRYFYDYEAIKEDAVTSGRVGTLGGEKARKTEFAENDPMYRGGSEQSGRTITVSDKRNKRSVWTIPTKPFKGAHFAVMPEALVEPCVLAGSAEGDTVLDPFAGSGTVGVVSLRHGRNFIGCELNSEYASIAESRIESDNPLFNSVDISLDKEGKPL